MKVRWTENSLRLRITPTELEALRRGDALQTTLRLPGGGWTAIVAPVAGGETFLCAEGCELRLRLAASDVARLAAPDAEGVYFHIETDAGRFRYFVEKDFPCAHPRTGDVAEPVTEAFTPPEGFAERKGVG